MTRPQETPRMARERHTIQVMVAMYCHDRHGRHQVDANGLCPDCAAVSDYAMARLDKCPFRGPEKPTCLKCPVHCYQPKLREKVREIMRYSGPRMLTRHPILALMHLLDSR